MRPEEIRPDTKLCTIIGYNAQTGKRRRYFNKILKLNKINATAIALNIKDEHFDFTMKNLANSKVDKMMIEDEFQMEAISYCDKIDGSSEDITLIDFVEVIDKKIVGFNLDSKVDNLIKNPEFFDSDMILAIRMMLLANRWYSAKIDMDLIPTIVQK
jgi:shikimate 5-dehydrogenase